MGQAQQKGSDSDVAPFLHLAVTQNPIGALELDIAPCECEYPKNLRLRELPMTEPLELVRGTLDLMILKTLSWSPMHGLAILRWLEQTTRAQLQFEEGALYPALHRMEQKKWLHAEWNYTEQGRKAKFYRITAAGRRQLTAELSRWERYSAAIALVISSTPSAEAEAR